MTQVLVPRDNVNDETVVVLTIYVKSGEIVKAGDVVVDIETSKTNVAICSPEDGTIQHSLKPNSEVKVGEHLFSVVGDVGSNQIFGQSQENLIDASNGESPILSNAALKLAEETGVSLAGLQGWVSKKDIEKLAGIEGSAKLFPVKQERIESRPDAKAPLSSANQVFSLGKRKQAEIHNLEIGNHAATTSVIGIELKVPGARVVKSHPLFDGSVTDLVVYEAAKLLKKYPTLNGCYLTSKTWAAYDSVNFGWSFDAGKNLKVLAIKDADRLTLSELHEEVMRMLDLYESGKQIPIDLLTSSTVTITDLTRTGAGFVLPLINGRQSLILGVVKNSVDCYQIYASFDHRVSEGLEVANFLSEIKERVLSYFLDGDGVALVKCSVCEKSLSEELALGNRGFIKIVMKSGLEGSICRNCFDGW